MMQRNVFLATAAAAGIGYASNCEPTSYTSMIIINDCNQEQYSLDNLHCVINQAGYDISKEDTIKLARVVHRETYEYENDEGIDAVLWSIRNHVETARKWEQYDGLSTGGYPKGNDIGEVLERGQYDAINAYPSLFRTYPVNSNDPFNVAGYDREHMDHVLERIEHVFTTPLSQDPICGAATYKNDAASTQQWHRNMGRSGRMRGQFGMMQGYDGRTVSCWHAYIGERGVEHAVNGVHKFYRVDCDLDGIGVSQGQRTGWQPLVDHYDSDFCKED